MSLVGHRPESPGWTTKLELGAPAEEPDEFDAHIVGEIETVHEFR
ncbi:hypothetical protein ACFZC3_03900 [Streptomyces sp. NPDC007903]